MTVRGMTCEGCENTVREALEAVDGVTRVYVDRNDESVTVEGEPDRDTLVSTVTDAGYDVDED